MSFETHCARVTWVPGKPGGRNWVCAVDGTEERCQGCLDEDWHAYNRIITDSRRMQIEREERDAEPYGSRFAASSPEAKLVAEQGSASAALAVCRQYELTLYMTHLVAWDLPYAEALRRWPEIVAEVYGEEVP